MEQYQLKRGVVAMVQWTHQGKKVVLLLECAVDELDENLTDVPILWLPATTTSRFQAMDHVTCY